MIRLAGAAMLLGAALLLVGCGQPPAPEPTPPSAQSSVAATAAPAAVAVATGLPPAPPVPAWVERGDAFQQTLDIEMRTELVELGVAPAEATDVAARDFAYLVCSTLRAGLSSDEVVGLVQVAYPTADYVRALSMVVTAQGYCLDTVAV